MATQDILENARQRAQKFGLPYAGALTPSEAYELMLQDDKARLIDVRSQAELDFVGRVPGAVEIVWKSYPGMQSNPHFLEQLRQQVPVDSVAMFICRSGARSHSSAMVAAQAGYASAYNVLEGFEGDCDGEGHRNTVGGWRAAGLPWVQS